MLIATPIKKEYLLQLNTDKAIHQRNNNDLCLLYIFDLANILSLVEACDALLILYYEECVKDSFYPLLVAYIKAFHEAKKPIFGVQEGMLMLNHYFQGNCFPISYKRKKHLVFFHKNALLKSYYPKFYFNTNEIVKEIDTLGKFLQIEAINKHGIIEAISFNKQIYAIKWSLNNDAYTFIASCFLKNLKHI